MTWEYIAGFFDGEGWIAKSPKPEGHLAKYTIGIGQSTKQADVLYVISEFLKSERINCRIYKECPEFVTHMTRLLISDSRSISNFLRSVLPFLLVKHEKAAAALADSDRCVARLEDRISRNAKAVQMRLSGASVWEITKATNVRKGALYRALSAHKLQNQ